MAISPERIQQLETQHGRIAHVMGKDGTWDIVLRKPTRAEYKMFRGMASAPESRADAQESLLRRIVVEPEGAKAIDDLINEWPGLPESDACTKAILMLTGMASEQLGK